MKLDVRLKRRYYEKLCCEGTSQFNIYFTSSVVVVDLPTDCILSFLFLAETDVLVLVFSQSTDVIGVNFLVVLKFPIIECFFAIMAYVPNTEPSKDPLLYKCHLIIFRREFQTRTEDPWVILSNNTIVSKFRWGFLKCPANIAICINKITCPINSRPQTWITLLIQGWNSQFLK